MMKHVLSSVALISLLSCGGDGGSSGLPDSKVVGTLTPAESDALCQEFVADFPARTIDCGGGFTVEIGTTAADCDGSTPPATCTATVGDFRECFDMLSGLSDAEFCMLEVPPAACSAVLGPGCVVDDQ